MKFKELAKQGAIPATGFPSVLETETAHFECGACRSRTNWFKIYMIHPRVPCCSEECMVVLNERERRDLEEYEREKLLAGPAPSVVEQVVEDDEAESSL